MPILKDRHLGIIGLIGFSYLLYTLKGKTLQTKAFPMALLIILMVLCVVLILRKKHNEKTYDFSALKSVAIYVALFALYVVLLPHIGFMIATTLFLSAFLLLQRYPIPKYQIILLSVVISVVLWLLFAKGFGVRLPEILFR